MSVREKAQRMTSQRLGLCAAAWIALAGIAYAQPAPRESKGYAEAVAQSAFGNVTSQSYGGEVGVAIRRGVDVFVEGGYTRDTAPATLSASAETIAAGITAVAGNAAFHAKQPVTFGVAGLKYIFPTSSKSFEPYVLAGGGVAKVKRDVSFSTSSGDVTQFVTLGSDLSGSETKGMISVGGGIAVPVVRRMILDLQYRFGRVFTSGEGLNVNRAGVGIGVRF
jgi:opacity protein-like surface antigen